MRREQRKHMRKMKKDTKQNPRDNSHSDTSPTICATIPYIEGVSEAIRRVLAPLDIGTTCTTRKRKWTLMKRVKDSIPKELQPGVVYAVGCADCEKVYVGETTRTAKERMKEHRCHTRMGKGELSAIAQHVMETGHEIHWNPQILAREKNSTRRKVCEALTINRLDSTRKKTINQDKGLELSKLWF